MKYIYLDQMKWIEIAKFIHCGEGDAYIADIVNLMDDKVTSNEWAFPLSVIHMVETSSRLDKRTRQQLSSVMSRFADNYTILPYISFYKQELLNSVMDTAGYSNHKINIAEKAISHDILGAVGSSFNNIKIVNNQNFDIPDFHDEIKAILSNSKIFEILTDEISSNELATTFRDDSLYTVTKLNEAREELHKKYPNKDIRYCAFLGESFCDIYNKELESIAKFSEQIGISKDKFILDTVFSSIESTINFMRSIPSFNVRTELLYEIMNNSSHIIKANDNKDISFLSAAVPYCDVIITERTWVHVIKKRKLDDKYGTLISSQLDFLRTI